MSYSHNQKIVFWERTEDYLRSTEITMDGHQLSSDDTARVANAYVLWALTTQDLLGNNRLTSEKALRTWVINLARVDLAEVMSTCKQALACIRCWQPHTVVATKDSFKHYLEESGVRPGTEILRPLWPTLYEFAETFNKFAVINTLLQFVTRLTLQDADWLEDAQLKSYIEFEDRISNQQYPEEIIVSLNRIARHLLKERREVGRPKHGNGATSSTKRGAGIATKYTKFSHTWGTYQLQLKYETEHPLIQDAPVSGDEMATRIVFVPKGIDKKRVVSAEPICNMYYQHAFSELLDNMFQDEPRWRIDLHDQTHNQKLALLGSRTMSYATIDLSSASDSVTLSLIKGIFKGTWVLNDWLRCRTRFGLLPNNERIRLEKFAPMGSALCFPIECMVFSLIVQLANEINHVDTYFRIYGDDIVVHECIFDTTVDLLQRLHFDVNLDKSFGPYSQFTESCGIECYQGIDVTPFRLPRSYDIIGIERGRTSPGRVTGGIELCNRLYENGLFSARAYLLHRMLKIIPNLPFSDSLESGLYTPDASNYQSKMRYNADLQRIEHKVCVPVTTYKDVPDDIMYQLILEEYAYTTRSRLLDPLDRIDLRAGDSRTHLRDRWVWLG